MTPARLPSSPNWRPAFYAGLAFSAAATLLFWATDLDLEIARAAYSSAEPHWPGQAAQPWAALYAYGEAPALLTGVLAGLVAVLSYFSDGLRPWRGRALFLFLVLVLGPGVLVNVLGKGLAGRPRPTELFEFGGAWEFRLPFQLGLPGRGHSFLSGHAAMGFWWMALFYTLPSAKRWLGLAGGALFGALMGWARVHQGGHFASDVLLCGALLFSLMALLSPLVQHPPSPAFWRRPAPWLGLLAALAGWLVIGQPAYEERRFLPLPLDSTTQTRATDRLAPVPWPLSPSSATLLAEVERGDLALRLMAGPLLPGSVQVQEQAWGQRLPGGRIRSELGPLGPDPHASSDSLRLAFHQGLQGAWWGLRASYTLSLPSSGGLDLSLRAPSGRLSISGLPEGRRVFLHGLSTGQTPPPGFESMGNGGWVRGGELPLIALDVSAKELKFEP